MSLKKTTSLQDAEVSTFSSYSGFQKKTTSITFVTVKQGYVVSDPTAFVKALFATAWSINGREPTSMSVSIAGSSVDFHAAAASVGGEATTDADGVMIFEPITAAKKHFGSWPGKVPASIAGVSKQ